MGNYSENFQLEWLSNYELSSVEFSSGLSALLWVQLSGKIYVFTQAFSRAAELLKMAPSENCK